MPQVTLLAWELKQRGFPLPDGILTTQELKEELQKCQSGWSMVNYVYGADTELSVAALKDVCLTIENGEFVGLIGHTGSGKSTLVQHLNGLLKATDGKISYNGTNIYEKGYNLKELRSRVGLVFSVSRISAF